MVAMLPGSSAPELEPSQDIQAGNLTSPPGATGTSVRCWNRGGASCAGHPPRGVNTANRTRRGASAKDAAMRVTFLSDIHANFPALCNALEWAERHRADRVVCAGDIVGHGPHPTEVVLLLKEQHIPAIRGNVDRKLLKALETPRKDRSV